MINFTYQIPYEVLANFINQRRFPNLPRKPKRLKSREDFRRGYNYALEDFYKFLLLFRLENKFIRANVHLTPQSLQVKSRARGAITSKPQVPKAI